MVSVFYGFWFFGQYVLFVLPFCCCDFKLQNNHQVQHIAYGMGDKEDVTEGLSPEERAALETRTVRI